MGWGAMSLLVTAGFILIAVFDKIHWMATEEYDESLYK